MYYENVHIRVRLYSLQKITFTVIYLKYIILTLDEIVICSRKLKEIQHFLLKVLCCFLFLFCLLYKVDDSN